jgi:hypothetical protein|tara:strand:- start:1318 stop:2337 length:1020 start_codon:yes stop_codon:yes gene_type:complete
MAYIGKAPNTAIVNQATSQSFSGNGSTTAFTLTRSVNVGEDLEVFVNNVQQEPGSGKSYTASGTTLTFDEAPPSGTNNVYVIYRGEATINPRLEHDANNPLAATTGTFNRTGTEGSALTLQKDGTTFGTLGVDGSDLVIDGPSGHTGLRMTTSGLLPRQNGAIIDNTIDLGSGAYRYNDLYLGGGLYVGGTGTANHFDDYEEGEFDITTARSGVTGTDVRPTITGQYVKIGRMVFIDFTQKNSTAPYTRNGDTGYASGQSLTITSNLPFTPASSNSERLGWSRSLSDYDSLAVGFRNGSTTIYLGTGDDNNYVAHNNATTSNNQSNVTIQCQFCYFTTS